MKSLPLISLTSLFLFASCDDRAKTTATSAVPELSLDAWFVETAPTDPQPIHVVRTTAKPGDEVTISGRVMGRMGMFVEDRAAFILGDPAKLTPCNEIRAMSAIRRGTLAATRKKPSWRAPRPSKSPARMGGCSSTC